MLTITLRDRSGALHPDESQRAQVTLSPIADRGRLPIGPGLHFTQSVGVVKRSRVPREELERLADHVVSWNMHDRGMPAVCSRLAVITLLQYPHLRGQVSAAVRSLADDGVTG